MISDIKKKNTKYIHNEVLNMPHNYIQQKLTASLMKTEDGAPFHLGSLSGNICPITGSPKAPKIASTTQCSNTSPAPPPKTTITIEINTKENHHHHQHTSIP
jgi:hypothetical protein